MSVLSVIVPCYNSEKFIGRCLDSLVNQTLKDIEILVINDGSTDNSLNIINEYVEKYDNVKVFTIKNEGIANARNFGLDQVKTPYFGFLDSDDYADKNMFYDMYHKAIEEDSDVVVSNFTWIYPDSERLEKEGPYDTGKDMLIKLFAVLWNKIYKTEFIKNTGIRFPHGNRYEDACFLYCLTPNIKKLSFIDKSYVSYVQHGTSITHTNNNEVKNMITVFNIISKYYEDNGIFEKYYSELEYLHIKFFLGNSFLRSAKIKDKQDRKLTINLGWDLLNNKFPNWRKNRYLRELGGMKNLYFRMIYSWNINLFAFIFRHI